MLEQRKLTPERICEIQKFVLQKLLTDLERVPPTKEEWDAEQQQRNAEQGNGDVTNSFSDAGKEPDQPKKIIIKDNFLNGDHVSVNARVFTLASGESWSEGYRPDCSLPLYTAYKPTHNSTDFKSGDGHKFIQSELADIITIPEKIVRLAGLTPDRINKLFEQEWKGSNGMGQWKRKYFHPVHGKYKTKDQETD